jgi:hypothetical protein
MLPFNQLGIVSITASANSDFFFDRANTTFEMNWLALVIWGRRYPHMPCLEFRYCGGTLAAFQFSIMALTPIPFIGTARSAVRVGSSPADSPRRADANRRSLVGGWIRKSSEAF